MAEKPSVDSERLTALLEAAPDAVLFCDRSGTILLANSVAHETFGYPHAALIGENVRILAPDDIAPHHDGHIARYLSEGTPHIVGIGRDVEGKRRDGSLFPLHLSVGHAVDGGEDFFVGILHDLTSRRQVERALERSQRMEALGELTGGVAHDFNNLLTVITGNLELLSGRGGDPDDAGMLADALEAAELGISLTAQLLAFARRGVLKPEELDVNQVVAQMEGLLGSALGPEIDLTMGFAEDAWTVRADPAQLQTGLLNLAVNARTAMEGKGRLEVETANMVIDDTYEAQEIDVLPGEYVRITVTDNGAGMPDEVKRRAFEPFFTTKPAGEGTGLGLSLLYGFARQSGGHVTLYSEEGQGTSISIYLPRGRVAGAQDRRADLPAEAPLMPGQGERVLVAEDNPAVRRLTTARIEALGYTTLVAENADQALEMLRKNADIAVLVTDIVMPGTMTGYDLARQARRLRPHVGTILTTAYAGKLLDESLDRKHGFRILRKPYRQVELAALLAALLGT